MSSRFGEAGQAFSEVANALLPSLMYLADILPKESIVWKMKMLRTAPSFQIRKAQIPCAEGIWTAEIVVLCDLENKIEGVDGSSRWDHRWRQIDGGEGLRDGDDGDEGPGDRGDGGKRLGDGGDGCDLWVFLAPTKVLNARAEFQRRMLVFFRPIF